MKDTEEEGMVLEKAAGERRQAPDKGSCAIQEGGWGTLGKTIQKGNSDEHETCLRWQLETGLGRVIPSWRHLRALGKGCFSRREGAQPRCESQGCNGIKPTPEHLAGSLGGRGHVGHITGEQSGDIQ